MNRNPMTKFEDKTPVDFVIVGAGGAGGVMARELSTAGFQVVVLEQGPYLHEGDFEHDELKFKDVYDPPFIGREVLTNDHALQPNTFRKTEGEKAALTAFVQYGQCVGGGTVQFTGNYWRFHEVDFAERSRWDRSKARVWLIGRSHMQTSSLTTPRRSGNWEFLVWRERIPSTLYARSLIRCRPCRLSLPAFCWNGVRASWDGIPILRRWRFCHNHTRAGPHAHTVASVNRSDASGVPNRARSSL